jgi:hypothetical protein
LIAQVSHLSASDCQMGGHVDVPLLPGLKSKPAKAGATGKGPVKPSPTESAQDGPSRTNFGGVRSVGCASRDAEQTRLGLRLRLRLGGKGCNSAVARTRGLAQEEMRPGEPRPAIWPLQSGRNLITLPALPA